MLQAAKKTVNRSFLCLGLLVSQSVIVDRTFFFTQGRVRCLVSGVLCLSEVIDPVNPSKKALQHLRDFRRINRQANIYCLFNSVVLVSVGCGLSFSGT